MPPPDVPATGLWLRPTGVQGIGNAGKQQAPPRSMPGQGLRHVTENVTANAVLSLIETITEKQRVNVQAIDSR